MSHNANVIVIVADVLAFVFRDTQKNESQEYQFFGIKFRRKIGVCVYTFLCVEKTIQTKLGNISKTEPVLPEIDLMIQNIIHTSEKIIRDFSNSGEFPDDEKIPRKDLYLARCANYFSAKVVTLDMESRDAINANSFLKERGIEALDPKNAIPIVKNNS